ncbi:hypothetical protein BGX28_008182 [Mortierella sp. GBA30]|nr:hypothetical protein BGX28_008182 [Mortierella sp. GBA30]
MVTTRKRAAPAAKPVKRAAAPAPAKKNAPTKRSTKKAPVELESEDDEEDEDEDTDNDSDDQESEENQSNDDNSDEEEQADESEEDNEEEVTFKIHTPKASSTSKVAPAALPTITYEDDSEENDSDAAPEAETLSSAKAKILSAQDKEKSFLSKVQAEQKAKRVEREQKLKEQKEQSKKNKKVDAKRTQESTGTKADEENADQGSSTAMTTRSGLPTMLPMDILESVATMEDQDSTQDKTNEKKRKHMRPEDFALMELEAELKAEAQKRKKMEKIQKNVGPVTVKVLDQSQMAKGHTIPETIVDFRKQHFYGSKIQRKDAVLNISQRNAGAASKFNRRK